MSTARVAPAWRVGSLRPARGARTTRSRRARRPTTGRVARPIRSAVSLCPIAIARGDESTRQRAQPRQLCLRRQRPAVRTVVHAQRHRDGPRASSATASAVACATTRARRDQLGEHHPEPIASLSRALRHYRPPTESPSRPASSHAALGRDRVRRHQPRYTGPRVAASHPQHAARARK